jgi:hypothetical protein
MINLTVAEKAALVVRLRNRWTPDEDAFVKAHFRERGADWLCTVMARTRGAIVHRASVFGLVRTFWTKDEIAFLLANYEAHGAGYVAKQLDRPVAGVRCYAHKCGLFVNGGGQKPNPNARTRKLVAEIAREVGCTPEEVFGRRRRHVLVLARWRVARELRNRGYSLPKIGQQLGRDHTSILNALRRLEEMAA